MKRTMHNLRTNYKQIVLTLLISCSTVATFAQKVSLDSINAKFNRYRSVASSEKVYAHLDKNTCLVGETIWFRLYLVNESTHAPADLSKVAYVEVIDAFNHAVIQSKVALENGKGSGLLFIPASLPSANYTFRAYTNWMKNFSPDYFFHKEISIINSFKPVEETKPVVVAKQSIDFFPEGGSLVNGIRSRIAFRLNNQDSKNTAKIFLLDEVSDTISIIKPDSMGLGSFEMTPSKRNHYRVVSGGKINLVATKFPEVLDHGFVLSVHDSTESQLAIKIHASILPSESTDISLIIHSRNMVALSTTLQISNGKTLIMVDKANLYEGISHITIFNAELKPVCERLFFSPVKQHLNIQTDISQTQFGLRRKVAIDILTINENNDPISSNVSLSVNRLDSLIDKSDLNISSYLWLNSDLPDSPSLPGDFFNSVSNKKNIILDNIMMVNGWRKFKWESVVDGPPIISFAPEARGHIIMGNVNADGQPIGRVLTYLSSPGRNVQVYGSISDAKGNVKYEMKDFYGPRKVVVQTNFTLDSISRVNILSPYADKYSKRTLKPFTLSTSVEGDLTTRNISMQVQDIFYQDRGNSSRNATIDTTAFYGKADETFYLDDYTRFPVMEEIMREYVPGVLVRKRRDGFHFINLDLNHKTQFTEDPFIMLDGIPIFDADKIMAFDPLKVKKLEVIARRYYLSALSLPGVVSYTTYQGDLGGFQLDPKCVVIDYDGLQLQREFYSPNYDTKKLRDSRMPDQRNLLHWMPDIRTDTSGKTHIEFFTSDVEGNFKIMIEGMDPNGRAGSGSELFGVRAFEN